MTKFWTLFIWFGLVTGTCMIAAHNGFDAESVSFYTSVPLEVFGWAGMAIGMIGTLFLHWKRLQYLFLIGALSFILGESIGADSVSPFIIGECFLFALIASALGGFEQKSVSFDDFVGSFCMFVAAPVARMCADQQFYVDWVGVCVVVFFAVFSAAFFTKSDFDRANTKPSRGLRGWRGISD